MRVLVEIDLAQAEWIVTGFVAQEPRMIDVFYNRKDAHLTTGGLISGAPEDFITIENKMIAHEKDPNFITSVRLELKSKFPNLDYHNLFLPRSMSIRQAGKKSNHGLNYRLEYKNFSLHNEIPEGDGKKIVDRYRNIAYPRLPVWYKEIEDKIRKDRTLVNCFGDKREFRGPIGSDLFMAATAFIPQSTVARITKAGMYDFYTDTSSLLIGTELLAQVHDSCIFQALFSSWSELASICTRLKMHMSEPCIYHQREFTLRTDVKIGKNWGEMVEVKETGDPAGDLERAWSTVPDESKE